MDYCMNSAGISNPCIREYEIDTATDLFKGTVMTIASGKAKKAAEGDVILGILANDYKVEKDELDHSAGTGFAKVIVSPGALFAVKGKEYEIATVGNATTINISGDVPSVANALAGGFVKLVYKSESSENSDSVGTVRRITASSGTKLTVENGGISRVGDVYAVIPPVGFAYLALTSDSRDVQLATAVSKNEKVVAVCPEKGSFEIGFANTFFN